MDGIAGAFLWAIPWAFSLTDPEHDMHFFKAEDIAFCPVATARHGVEWSLGRPTACASVSSQQLG